MVVDGSCSATVGPSQGASLPRDQSLRGISTFARGGVLAYLALAPLGAALPGLLLLLWSLPKYVAARRHLVFGGVTVPGVAMVAIALVSGALAQYRLQAVGSAIALALVMLLGFMTASILVAEADFTQRVALPVATAGAAVAAGYTLATYSIMGWPQGGTPFVGYNGTGTLLVVFGVLGLSYLLGLHGRGRWLVFPFGLLAVAASVVTFSRGSWLGLLAAGAVFLLRSRRGRVALLACAAAGAVVWSLARSPHAFGGLQNPTVQRAIVRFESIWNIQQQMNRIAVWSDTLRLIKDHPLLGVGMDNFSRRFPEYVTQPAAAWGPVTPHNLWLTVAAEMGLVGLAAFAWLMARTAQAAWRLWAAGNVIHVGLAAALAGVLVREMFDHTVYSVHIGSVFWLLIAWILAAEAQAHLRGSN